MNHLGTQATETQRLILRQYKMTDADDMFRNWVADPEISRFWGWKPHINIEETKSLLSGWIKEYSRIDNYHWVIVLKETSQAIIDFSFSKIGMLCIHTHHHVDNPASGKVMQKSGLRYTETKYRQISDCEQISGDYCYYEISKDDWMRT